MGWNRIICCPVRHLQSCIRSLRGMLFLLKNSANSVLKPSYFTHFVWILHHFQESVIISSLLRKVSSCNLPSITYSNFAILFRIGIWRCIVREWRLILISEALSQSVVTITNLLLKFRDEELLLPLN